MVLSLTALRAAWWWCRELQVDREREWRRFTVSLTGAELVWPLGPVQLVCSVTSIFARRPSHSFFRASISAFSAAMAAVGRRSYCWRTKRSLQTRGSEMVCVVRPSVLHRAGDLGLQLRLDTARRFNPSRNPSCKTVTGRSGREKTPDTAAKTERAKC